MSSNANMSKSSSWGQFLKSIASFNGDLSSLTAPPFILSTTSLTEFSAYWTERPNIFIAPAKEVDPEKRALLVLKWYLSLLHQQYCGRSEKYGNEKKPLNPFLGELFLGKWEDDGEMGETRLWSEQVSHHPPVTAYAIRNEKHNIQLEGYNGQKCSFSTSLNLKQVGHACLTLTPPATTENPEPEEETYLITLPSLHIEGLIYAAPFVELDKSTYITSSTGYISKIDYAGKGWISGKKNSFVAHLYKADSLSQCNDTKKALYKLEGQWSDTWVAKGPKSGPKGDRPELFKWQSKKEPTCKLQVAPIEEQDAWESRRAWRDVAAGIERGDMEAVSIAKGKIENAQRELRKLEQAEARTWKRCFFKKVSAADEVEFDKLARSIGHTEHVDSEKTSGFWRVNRDAIREKTAPSYHMTESGEPMPGPDATPASSPATQAAQTADVKAGPTP
ncbi:Oxysterol binding protein [Ascosphaera pollenicola]|nr:Oxysterol binding protein [Ascosphaera pollenicola]